MTKPVPTGQQSVPDTSQRADFRRAVLEGLAAGMTANMQVQELFALYSDLGVSVLGDTPPSKAVPQGKAWNRQLVTDDLLREVVGVYRESCAAGRPPNVAIAERFGKSHRTATRWVREARKAGMLRPALGTIAGEVERDQLVSGRR